MKSLRLHPHPDHILTRVQPPALFLLGVGVHSGPAPWAWDPVQPHRTLLGFMCCCLRLEILTISLARGPALSPCGNWVLKSCTQFWLHSWIPPCGWGMCVFEGFWWCFLSELEQKRKDPGSPPATHFHIKREFSRLPFSHYVYQWKVFSRSLGGRLEGQRRWAWGLL